MGVRFLEHILILTHDPEGTRDWWREILGLREGPHPEFGFPVHWLYIGDQDVVHIGKAAHSDHQTNYLKAPGGADTTDSGATGGTGPIDHVCFSCEGIEAFTARLDANGVSFSERQAHNQALHQLFFREPINGIKVELNFSADEAGRAGRVPTMTGAGSDEGDRPAE